jgi:hypothetical protein
MDGATLSRCQDCGANTRVQIGDRIWCLSPSHPPTELPISLSQSELISTVRGLTHTHRPYPITQLIRDIEELTPEHLDLWARRQAGTGH